MDDKLFFGSVVGWIGAILVGGLLGWDLFRDVETSVHGERVTATVVHIGTATDAPRYEVSFAWAGRPRTAITEWLPGGTRQGEAVSVIVNRRDPEFVIGAGTTAQRGGRYAGYVLLIGFLVLIALGFRAWRRREIPRAERRPARFVIGTPPARAERRARRRRQR